jgi:hypothetical protein
VTLRANRRALAFIAPAIVEPLEATAPRKWPKCEGRPLIIQKGENTFKKSAVFRIAEFPMFGSQPRRIAVADQIQENDHVE